MKVKEDLTLSKHIEDVIRALNQRSHRSDSVTVHHLLEKAGMTSVNRMAAAAIIMEMWRTMGGNSIEKENMAAISSTLKLYMLIAYQCDRNISYIQNDISIEL
jgi:hypothetical protein